MLYTFESSSQFNQYPAFLHSSTYTSSKVISFFLKGLLFFLILVASVFFVFLGSVFISELGGIDLVLPFAVGAGMMLISIPGLILGSRLPKALVLNTDKREIHILETLDTSLDSAPSFSFNEITEVSCNRHVSTHTSDDRRSTRVSWHISLTKRDGAEWILCSLNRPEAGEKVADQIRTIFGLSPFEEIQSDDTKEFTFDPINKTEWTLESKENSLYHMPLDINKKEDHIGIFTLKKNVDSIEISWKKYPSPSRTIASYLFAIGCFGVAFGFSNLDSILAWFGGLFFILITLAIFKGVSKSKEPRWIRITPTLFTTPPVITPFSGKDPLQLSTSDIYSAFFNLSDFSYLQVMTRSQYEEKEMYKKQLKAKELDLKTAIKAALFQKSLLNIDVTTLSISDILILENLIEQSVQEMSGQTVL